MYKFLYGAIILTLTIGEWTSLKAGEPVRLRYQSNKPVAQTSQLEIRLNQSLPGFKLDARGNQTAQLQVTIEAERTPSHLTKPPFDLLFVMNRFKLDLKANNDALSFDSQDPDAKIGSLKISKLIDRPLKLHIGEKGFLQDHTGDVQKLIEELPYLKDLDIKGSLIELFQYPFSLAGKDLVIGYEYTQELPGDSSAASIKYEITSITPNEIHAAIAGDIAPRKIKLRSPVVINKKREEVDLVLTGTRKGSIIWQRDNALLYKLQVQHTYKGVVKVAGWDWVMSVLLTHQLVSAER